MTRFDPACRSCGAPIRWGTNGATGKPIPIDAAPDPQRGNVSAYQDATSGKTILTVLTAPKAAAMRAADVPLHLSHFATCPHAGQWRKKNR